ncbi:hypothetical protein CN505_20475 [Bacillus cereus]|nr:hypothetical protein CN509_09150 [Bacillus cereus]PET02910.1 hypothetical protein CN505_20475 [Bacillus cereus]
MTRTKTVADAEILDVIEEGNKLIVHVWNVDGTERDVYVVKGEKEKVKYELIDYEGDADKEIIEKIMHDERFEPFQGLRLIALFK